MRGRKAGGKYISPEKYENLRSNNISLMTIEEIAEALKNRIQEIKDSIAEE